MPEKESKIVEKYEKASKFDKEELEKVEKFQKDYFEIQQSFGNISIMRVRAEQQFEAMDKAQTEIEQRFKKVQEEEREFVEEIQKKYGPGSLNPQTGEYSLNK